MVTVIGSSEITQQPDRIEYQKGGGKVLIRAWEGPLEAIEAQAEVLDTDDAVESYTLEKGPKARIEARYPDETDGVEPPPERLESFTEWDIQPSEFSKPLASHPYFDPDSDDNSGLSGAEKTDLRNQINVIENDLTDASVEDVGGKTYGSTGPVQTITSKYAQLRLKGVEEYGAYTYVVRQTQTVSANQLVEIAIDGVGEVGELPDLVGANGNVEDFINSLGGEWLKLSPYVRRASRLKYEAVLEWQWANEFSPTLYPGGGADV